VVASALFLVLAVRPFSGHFQRWAIRIISPTCVLVLLYIHSIAAWRAGSFLQQVMSGMSDQSSVSVELCCPPAHLAMPWYHIIHLQVHVNLQRAPRVIPESVSSLGPCEHERCTSSNGSSVRRFKKFFVLLFWHISGRTMASQAGLFIVACNFFPLIPQLQRSLYSVVTVMCLVTLFAIFPTVKGSNPVCTNTSGDDVTESEVGFGMLVSYQDLLHLVSPPSEHGHCTSRNRSQGIFHRIMGWIGFQSQFDSHVTRFQSEHETRAVDMIPAVLDRLCEAITVSYRWDTQQGFPVYVWSGREPKKLCLDVEWLLENMPQHLCKSGTLLWIDQLSIDQQSPKYMRKLIPRMTMCYALSISTLVVDNSHQFSLGHADNYFSRIWTYQEFCLPASLIYVRREDRTHDLPEKFIMQRKAAQVLKLQTYHCYNDSVQC